MTPMAPLYMTPPCSQDIQDEIRAGQLGMIATPAQGNVISPRYRNVVLDNGVFGGAYPGDEPYLRWLADLREQLGEAADHIVFATAPDVVGDHLQSWARSREMLPRIRALGFAAAFVAQDGMEFDGSCWMWDEFDVLFIGGSTAWKLGAEAAALARTARAWGKWVHVGRVNTWRRYRHAAIEMNADSVDGTKLTKAPDRYLPEVLDWAQRIDAQDGLWEAMAHELASPRFDDPLLRLPFQEVAVRRPRIQARPVGTQLSLFEGAA
jgi:hypothetical protein